MSKQRKVLFRISLGLNLLLIAIVVWGYMKINFVSEQVFITEVQHNLVELEALIANQSTNNWPEPNLVTTQLGDVIDGIWIGLTTSEQLGVLSDQDREIISKLRVKLTQYPNDTNYKFVEVTQEDKEDFEELRKILRNAGLGMQIQTSGDMKSFMNQIEKLIEGIEAQQIIKASY